MKLLFIYGSPAVGKLTVANEIARKTGFKVFHNHLSIDCVKPIFEFGTPSFWRLIDLIRVEVVTEAARVGQNLIYTFCYAKDQDDAHVEKIAAAVEANGGEVCFVLLRAEKDEIERRVLAASRREFKKIASAEMLRGVWDEYELFSPVNHHESLIVDNTHLSPVETAERIVEYFSLPGVLP